MKMFAIYDSKAEAYLAPIFCPTTAVALRMFRQAAEEEGHTFHKHAGDYTLFELGEWNEQTAVTTQLNAQVNLGTALMHQRPTIPLAEATDQAITDIRQTIERERTA